MDFDGLLNAAGGGQAPAPEATNDPVEIVDTVIQLLTSLRESLAPAPVEEAPPGLV